MRRFDSDPRLQSFLTILSVHWNCSPTARLTSGSFASWVWRFVFSVAVFTAMLGFFALVLHRGVWPIAGLLLFAIGIQSSTILFSGLSLE